MSSFLADGELPAGIFERAGDRFVPSVISTGPWSEAAMHGGPPAALVARLVDAWDDGGHDWWLARLSIELVRPVPVEPLRVTIEPRRLGRRIQLLDAVVHDHGGTEVLVARALRVRAEDNGIDESELLHPGPPAVPAPEECPPWARRIGGVAGASFADAMELRLITGQPFDELGPARAWFRLRLPLFAGQPIHPLDRLVTTADFANGLSNVVSFDSHRYLNADLSVALHRFPVGDWVLLDATTHARRDGYGTAYGILADRDGELGVTVQSLLVAAR